jgi:hypothetical protein
MKEFIKGMYNFHSYKHLFAFVLMQMVMYIGVTHGAAYFFDSPMPTLLGARWAIYSVIAVILTGIVDRAIIMTSPLREQK